ncbi:hypothetical protein [Mycobacterium colombiense]|uniref:hypothetical protein n=1 Tax=Mycobacterium colombiense TaxID=339268 RepID=UPI0010576CC8|nr:hypothetical protein [Mycobacterium colombiense]
MNRSTKLWALAATTLVIIAAAAYIGAQYVFAHKPSSLASLPEYPFVGSAYPLDAVPGPERARAEAALRQFAAGVEPGYRPTAERFLASKGDFIWDAVRNSVGGYLSATSLRVHNAGQTRPNGEDLAFVVWSRTNRLQRWFNPTQILAVGSQDALQPAAAGDQVHVYAYFDLTPERA